MFDVIMFIAKWIIDFIISLNKVMIPGTNMSLLRFFLSVLVLKTAFGFLFSFIQMEKRYREKDFRSKLHKKITAKGKR